MTFDPYDQNSWFFGSLSRNQAIEILKHEKDKGVFLVRNSTSIVGDLVLSVKEENKISHYIINKIEVEGESRFKIGENTFHDLPTLLTFYKHHYLDTTPLVKAAIKKLQYVRAKFEFFGKDKDDLPFKKNEILAIISKDEDQWWTARNDSGTIGSIPVPYVDPIDEDEYLNEKSKANNNLIESDGKLQQQQPPSQQIPQQPALQADNQSTDTSSLDHCRTSLGSSNSSASVNSQLSGVETKSQNSSEPNGKKSVPNLNRKLPAKAVVVQQRIPNAYDKKALRLEKGEIILVTSTNINGQWEGEVNGKKGHFPFNYIKFLEEENAPE